MSVSDIGQIASEGDAIKVFVRIRPPDTYDVDIGTNRIVDVDESGRAIIFHSKPEPKIFTFDHVADINTTQESIFGHIGRKIIDSCINGYNSTIFAYGQTGSGKTFTMLGPSDEMDNFQHELRGVIPRSFEYLFNLIQREKELNGKDKEFLCKCSFLEIYHETVYDLLDPSDVGLQLRESMKKGTYVEGLLEQTVSSASEAYQVLSSGWINRRVASTSMNRESSRSHAVFTVVVESKEKKGGIQQVKSSVLNLVDLAGSERQKDTQSAGQRLKEAGSINKSLSVLGNVIMSLVDIAHGKKRHIPYRDSKLTFLLRDSLGGNAKTHIVACVHPGAKCFGETLSTLNFARRAKMIKNKAVVNADMQGNVLELQAEIRRLKEVIQQLQGGALIKEAATLGSVQIIENVDNLNESEWKQRFMQAMLFREKSEGDKKLLNDKIKRLEEMCNKKEKFLQSSKMIIKLRENAISRLEKKEKNEINLEEFIANQMADLKSEIKALKDQVEHHPTTGRYKMDVDNLKSELKQFKGESNTLLCPRKYEELEKNYKDLMSEKEKDPEQMVYSTPTTTPQNVDNVATATIEKYKSQISNLQEENDSLKQNITELKESWQKKELELNSEVESQKKMVTELNKALEAHQMMSKLERNALNDMHLQAVKTMTTPQKKRKKYELRNRVVLSSSASNTPSLNDSIVFEDGSNGISMEAEPELMVEQAQHALMDEVKQLQDEKNKLTQRLEEYERDTIQLNQQMTKLEHQKVQLEEILNQERSEWNPKQDKLQLELRQLKKVVEESKERYSMLEEENRDIKIVMESADKESRESKVKLKNFEKVYQETVNDLSTKIVKFEAELNSISKAHEDMIEERDRLQEDCETAQCNITFLESGTQELQEMLQKERSKYAEIVKEKEEISVMLEKEQNNYSQLLQQMHTQGAEKEKTIYQIMEDKTQLEQTIQDEKSSNEKKQQIIDSQAAELQVAQTKINLQQKTMTENMEALSSFMAKNQELKASLSTKSDELDDMTQKYQDIQKVNEEQAAMIEGLKEQIDDHEKEKERQKNAYEMEISMLKDDLEYANDVNANYKEEMEAKQVEIDDAQNEVKKKVEEIKVLMQQHEEKEKSHNTQIAELQATIQENKILLEKHSENEELTEVLDEKMKEINSLKDSASSLNKIIEDYETGRKEKNEQIEDYKNQIQQLTIVKEQNEKLESDKKNLEYKIENERSHYEESLSDTKQKFDQLEQELQVSRAALQNESGRSLQLQLQNSELQDKINELESVRKENKELEEQVTNLKRYSMEKFEEHLSLEAEKKDIEEQLHSLQKEFEAFKVKYKKMEEENVKLAGHQNLKQKIHYTHNLKEENNSLRQENQKLVSELRFYKGKGTPSKDLIQKKMATPLKESVDNNSEIPKCLTVKNSQTPASQGHDKENYPIITDEQVKKEVDFLSSGEHS